MRKTLLIAATAALAVSCSVGRQAAGEYPAVKNVILMVPDGTSTSVLADSRWYKNHMASLAEGGTGNRDDISLNVDPYLCGLVRSYMSDSPISGSAGAMSCYMTGQLAQSPNISVYPGSNPAGEFHTEDPAMAGRPALTVMEAARLEKGKAVGLVVTVQYNHATPAACFAHSVSRDDYLEISKQMASFRPEVVFGGGTRYLKPQVREILAQNGTVLAEDDIEAYKRMDGAKGGCWALWGSQDMSYELERDPAKEPSLAEMTRKAISILSKDKDGFFLMVEGSKVDFAAHSNDAAGVISEFLAFDDAIGAAIEFARKDGHTAVVVLPDHGTSAITFANRTLRHYSSRSLSDALEGMDRYRLGVAALSARLKAAGPDKIAETMKEWTDIDLTAEETAELRAFIDKNVTDYMAIEGSLDSHLTNIMNSRAHFGYASTNHTAEDVFLAVYAPGSERLEGIHTNAELNGYLCSLVGLDSSLSALTQKYFAPAAEVFAGMDMTLTEDEATRDATLVVRKGSHEMKLVSYRSYVEVDGVRKDIEVPAVYIKKNGAMYVPRSLASLL